MMIIRDVYQKKKKKKKKKEMRDRKSGNAAATRESVGSAGKLRASMIAEEEDWQLDGRYSRMSV